MRALQLVEGRSADGVFEGVVGAGVCVKGWIIALAWIRDRDCNYIDNSLRRVSVDQAVRRVYQRLLERVAALVVSPLIACSVRRCV